MTEVSAVITVNIVSERQSDELESAWVSEYSKPGYDVACAS